MEKGKNTNSPDSTNLEISDDLDCGIIQTFASVRYGFDELKSSNIVTYNNEKAHAELKSMMERGERLSLYFTIDTYGMEAVCVESKTTSRFNYQLNPKSFTWIMKYLTSKETEDFEVIQLMLKRQKYKMPMLFVTTCC